MNVEIDLLYNSLDVTLYENHSLDFQIDSFRGNIFIN